MIDLYKIEGTEHPNEGAHLNDPTFYPNFKIELFNFKSQLIKQFLNNDGKTYIHFGDGDYHFLKKNSCGSACPGKRALSKSYDTFDITPFTNGWLKSDYHCVECLEIGLPEKLNELYPNLKTIPTEYLYGLTCNKWFFKTFKGKIGLIGAKEKLDLIKELMTHEKYQEYLGLEKFNDYITIPQKYACDDLDNTINIVKKQLENADPETKVYLFGVGHVKSGLIHHLPKIKNAIYLDIGAGIDGIAGILDPLRPYAKAWTNYRLTDYNYSKLDLLQYNQYKDRNIVYL